MPAPRRRWPAAALLLSVLLFVVGCGGNAAGGTVRSQGQGEPRPFLMGLSSVPPQPTDEAYKKNFELAGKTAEVVLIQRAPPWDEFVPGGTISSRTERLTRLERDLAKKNDVRLFLAIDPTDPADRGSLASLPEDLLGADFSENRVRAAFISYAKYLALNYKPAYLALGVEVDMFFNRRGDAAFRNFQSLYFEAYDAVKSVSASTMVFPTFQFEDMQGNLDPNAHTQPAWALVARFEPKLDAVAVTSFPGFVYRTMDRVPTDYFTELKVRFDKPLILASIGWSSGQRALDGISGEGDQAAFLSRSLAQAESLGFTLVVWYLVQDVAPPVTAGFEPLATSGLLRTDGQGKPAWSIWRTFAGRPVQK